jgi:hypothetical protein
MRRYSILLAPLCVGLLAWSAGPATAIVRGANGAALFGENEIPGPGDPDGVGTVTLRFDPDEGTVCFTLRVSGIAPATAAHIHLGGPGVAGPVVVPLTPPPTSGRSSNCVPAATALVQNLIDNPQDYYVNVHNATYPAGALRGQLR